MVKPLKDAAKFLWNGTVYALSLPERYVRGLSALLGGIFKETTDILVPGVVKDTTSYNIFVGNILRFTGVARKVQLMLESKANAQYIAQQTPVEVVEDSVA